MKAAIARQKRFITLTAGTSGLLAKAQIPETKRLAVIRTLMRNKRIIRILRIVGIDLVATLVW
jgi:hypothetical protein